MRILLFNVGERIERTGTRLLGIELLDHIIIGDNCYVSLALEGYLGNA